MGIIPPSRPKLTKEETGRILNALGIDRKIYPVCVLAVRGYYVDSMGKPGVNDRALYDDACLIHSAHAFGAFNWNTDPTRYRLGKGVSDATKGMASLKPGVWEYKIGAHKGKAPAGVQAKAVTVIRDGSPDYEDTGFFGINLHRGSNETTSSEGCQTAPPGQWPEFIDLLVSELKFHRQDTFKYALVTNDEMKRLLERKSEPEEPGWLMGLKAAISFLLGLLKNMFSGKESNTSEMVLGSGPLSNMLNVAKIKQEPVVLGICKDLLENRASYERVAEMTGCPWYVVAAIHSLESNANFKAVLHNGEKIIGSGKKTTLVPAGRGPFATWEEAAVDALTMSGVEKISSWDSETALDFLEKYNGLGYRSRGVPSPYLWSFTTQYIRGKFVRDGVYDPNFVSAQVGAAALFLGFEKLGQLSIV